MCRVTVNCHCHTGSGAGWIGVAALGVLGAVAAPVIVAAVKAAVDLLTAIVIGIVSRSASSWPGGSPRTSPWR
jgi:hypothetical protein